jgi:hypothetical protein
LFRTPDPDPTFKEVSAPTPDMEPTPDPDPDSDPATLVSASRELRGKLELCIREITTIYQVFFNLNQCKVGHSGKSIFNCAFG